MKKIYTREEIKRDLVLGVSREIGICETIRNVYDLVYEMPEGNIKEQMTEKLIDALHMGKKMGDRLTYYAQTYKDPTGAWGEHLVALSNAQIRSLVYKRRPRLKR